MLLGALLLAGCGSGGASAPDALERSNLSMAEATDLVGQRYPLREGLWEATGGITRFDIADLPGDPPQTRDLLQMIRSRVATRGRMGGRACLRPEDARNALASLPGMDPNRCRVEHFRLAGDRGTMILACAATASGNGGSRIEIATTYAADSRTVETNGTMTMSPEPGAAPREAHLTSSTTLRRVGDCPPGQRPAAAGAASRP